MHPHHHLDFTFTATVRYYYQTGKIEEMIYEAQRGKQAMQDAQSTHPLYQNVPSPPDCKTLNRFLALVLDSVFLAILFWIATHAFGTAQLSNIPQQVVGSLIGNVMGPSGGYSVSDGMGLHTIAWTTQLSPLWLTLLVFLYFTLQEAFFARTLGKAIMGLRVICQEDETTYSHLTLKAVLVRNGLRLIDGLFFYAVGAIVMLTSQGKRRLGDLAAHTLVVNVASVPYLLPARKQTKSGPLVMTALLLAFLFICSLFTYFGRPPLVVQNTFLTQPPFFTPQMPTSQIIRVSSLTLGQASWRQNGQGQPTITYPISFLALSQVMNPSPNQNDIRQTCQGSITLTWSWFALDWEPWEYSGRCRDVP
ncbi:MAG TPA: RDD family protein [Ktedonobacteraceae bacterium]|nr:RDD family protein [Ktedonobacteraceae bacterium]